MKFYSDDLKFALALAREAGDIMRKHFGQKPDRLTKEDYSIVTIADTEINSLVIKRVKEAYPDDDINGEEESHATSTPGDRVWVCDPIDGTALFARNIPMSVFSLSLVIDGVPVLGVVYDPYQDRMYHAVTGGGAFLNDDAIHVNDGPLDSHSLMSFDYWQAAGFEILVAMDDLTRQQNTYAISPGSATHSTMLVAAGHTMAHVFPGTKGKNVDMAAAKVIVEEAGGKVTDFFGNDQRYDQDLNGCIVSNGVAHDVLVNLINKHFKDPRA